MMSTMEEEPVVEINNELEDGEISDSEVGDVDYTPLTRPDNLVPHFNPASIMSMNIRDDMSDDSNQEPSSEEDSDSDNPAILKPKKPKIKVKKRERPGDTFPSKMDKYKIWCSTAGEDTLTEELVSFDVARNKTHYGVESYSTLQRYDDYVQYNGKRNDRSSFEEREMITDKPCNKRSHKDRKSVKLRLGRRISLDSDHERGDTRCIPDLTIGLESTDEDLAKDIAEKLREEKHDLILRMVKIVGKEKIIELFKETKRIEEDGGMMIMNGTRRRTPGGVLIFLLKRDKNVSQEIFKEIFVEDKRLYNKQKKRQAKNRDKEVQQLKQSLNDGALPVLRQRAEQWAASNNAVEDTSHVSNPPPSPVTDGRDGSSDADTNHFSHHCQTVENAAENLENFLNSESGVGCLPQNKETPNLTLDPRALLQQSCSDDDCIDIMCNDDMDLF